jgi:hypothetical protein
MKMRLFKLVSIGIVLVSFGLAGSVATIAQTQLVRADTTSEIQGGVNDSGGTGAKNQGNSLPDTIRTVVNILLFLIGVFAVIMIVIAGFRLVAANGDANTVTQARNTILYSVIGIVVAFLAFALVNFVVDQLSKSTTPTPAAGSPSAPSGTPAPHKKPAPKKKP